MAEAADYGRLKRLIFSLDYKMLKLSAHLYSIAFHTVRYLEQQCEMKMYWSAVDEAELLMREAT